MSAPRGVQVISLLLVLALGAALFFWLRGAPAQREELAPPQDDKQARAAAHFALLAAERYLSSGELEEAFAEARRARALAPELPAPHRVLAAAHQLDGDDAAACAEMRRYVDKAGSSPEVRARLLKTMCADAG